MDGHRSEPRTRNPNPGTLLAGADGQLGAIRAHPPDTSVRSRTTSGTPKRSRVSVTWLGPATTEQGALHLYRLALATAVE